MKSREPLKLLKPIFLDEITDPEKKRLQYKAGI